MMCDGARRPRCVQTLTSTSVRARLDLPRSARELTWVTLPVGQGTANLFLCPNSDYGFIVDMGA